MGNCRINLAKPPGSLIQFPSNPLQFLFPAAILLLLKIIEQQHLQGFVSKPFQMQYMRCQKIAQNNVGQ